MMYLDGIPINILPDKFVLAEYNSIRLEQWDEYYNDKGMYLFFRQRELMYELQRRDIETLPPHTFVGFDKANFNHHTPTMGRRVRALSEVVQGFKEGDMFVKKPMPQHQYRGFISKDYTVQSIVQYGLNTEHGRKTQASLTETRVDKGMG